jgi:hypothetical protein
MTTKTMARVIEVAKNRTNCQRLALAIVALLRTPLLAADSTWSHSFEHKFFRLVTIMYLNDRTDLHTTVLEIGRQSAISLV